MAWGGISKSAKVADSSLRKLCLVPFPSSAPLQTSYITLLKPDFMTASIASSAVLQQRPENVSTQSEAGKNITLNPER